MDPRPDPTRAPVAPPAEDYLAQVFGPGGLFAARDPNYRPRAAQITLARAIDRGMREGRAVLAEGPCGTGKSFAYAVPAVYHAARLGKRVVIATANIALQEQLVRADLPRLARVLPWPFTFALLKGRSNYLCRDRLAGDDPLGFTLDEAAAARAIAAWARDTPTGDAAELPFEPAPSLWAKLSVTSETCKREGCRFQQDCFADRARAAAAEADVVVTNYHLLFAHVAVHRATGRDLVLPPFDLLVCDEAHEAADIAREFLGFSLGPAQVAQLAWHAFALGRPALADAVRARLDQLLLAAAAYATSPEYRVRLQRPGFLDASPALATLREVERVAGGLDAAGEEKETRAIARNAARLARVAAAQIEELVAQSDPNKVYWLEPDPRGRAALRARPLEVGAVLRDELFARTPSVTLTSATLAAGDDFTFARRELGVPDDALEARVASPFDFAAQARLIVPTGLPEPGEDGYVEAVAGAMRSVVEQCDGRTLGLFASQKNLAAVYERVREAAGARGHRVLRQGELPRRELARIFTEDVHSVLLGTRSFRTGFDVPGEALTGLVIDKIPFPSPDEPMAHAVHARNPRAFWDYALPRAIIALRQAVGRLIRSGDDVGVVVILDARLHTRRYRAAVLASLPPMPRGTDLGAIAGFLARKGVGGRARAGGPHPAAAPTVQRTPLPTEHGR